jgi:hypothetical protein
MKLTVGCKDYEWLEPLIHGYVTSDKLDLQFFTEYTTAPLEGISMLQNFL